MNWRHPPGAAVATDRPPGAAAVVWAQAHPNCSPQYPFRTRSKCLHRIHYRRRAGTNWRHHPEAAVAADRPLGLLRLSGRRRTRTAVRSIRSVLAVNAFIAFIIEGVPARIGATTLRLLWRLTAPLGLLVSGRRRTRTAVRSIRSVLAVNAFIAFIIEGVAA